MNRYIYCTNNPHKYIDPTGHFGIGSIDLSGVGQLFGFLGGMLGGIIDVASNIFGGSNIGTFNPTPDPDTTVSVDGITGGYYEPSSLDDLNDYLDNSGIILSSDEEEQYDDFVEGLNPIKSSDSHKEHAEAKGIPFAEYRGPAVKDELAFRLNNLDDPSINLYFDTDTGNWNIDKYGDVIGFNAYEVTTWFESTYNFMRDRWIPFPVLPFP